MNKNEEIFITKYDLLFESRLTKVETTMDNLDKDIKEIKTDIRWMLGLMISFSTIMIGIMAKGFHWL